jgi:hypothetical protein
MRFILVILIFTTAQAFGQGIRNMNPTLGYLVDLSIEGEAKYKKPELMDLGYHDVIGFPFEFTAESSSKLKPDSIAYSAKNAIDLSYKTAWVEGVAGYGIGESLTIHFLTDYPIIGKLVFVNGWVRSKELWDAFSRPKTLEMFVNGKPFAILNLANTRQEQIFSFEAGDWAGFKGESWTMEFRILDVYMGDRYDKTAITEMYVGGLSVDK